MFQCKLFLAAVKAKKKIIGGRILLGDNTGLFEMIVGVLTNATSFSRCKPV